MERETVVGFHPLRHAPGRGVDRLAALFSSYTDNANTLLAGETIVLADFNLTTTTDEQGHFTFTVQAPQQRSVRLMAQKQGYTPHDTYATLGNPSFNFIMRKAP